MLDDIFTQPQNFTIDKKEYSLEFDHNAYALFERLTRKSIYEVYKNFINQEELMYQDILPITHCALKKYHSEKEINNLQEKIKKAPNLWHEISNPIMVAFVTPLLPPQILKEMETQNNSKKKVPKKKKQNTTGLKTTLSQEHT